MEQQEKSFLEAFDEKKNAGTLRTLTVLTFIGCGLLLFGAVWGFFTAKQSYEAMDKLMSSGDLDKIPAMLRGMYTPELLEVTRKTYENRLPLLVINLASGGLCLYGAIKMRALKSEGFIAWLIGELLPYLGYFIFIGAASFTGISFWIGAAVNVLFIALYAAQRKHLS
jgi:hypothetical protein